MDKYRQILQENWGYDDFRGIQREIIESIGSGRDTLGLMPTGGGKSITFQVPALAREKVCIVITPLIALMKDQVFHLRQKGIQAAAVYSGMSHDEIVITLDNAIYGGIRILYVSPERLASELFQIKIRRMKVSFITVDEAHCISQWGYDFRPAYLEIANIRKLVPDVPILALTATATPRVIDDIQEKLLFKEKNFFRMSFERKNLAYVVRVAYDKYDEMLHILRSVAGSSIVYVRSRRRSKEISDYLNQHGITATFYHAGLENVVKDQRQQDWQYDEIRVMVATNAFGMGIDKPDVRTVLHIDCPDSIEAYFQEAGRAGRDGKKSYAILLYNDSDKHKLLKRVTDNFPEKDYIRSVYEHLAFYYEIGVGSGMDASFQFDIDKFCHTYRFFPIQVDSALRILQRAGYLDYDTDPDTKARVLFLLNREELYRLKNVTPIEEAVITSILRNYGGLFTDYCYIDEAFIAQQTELNQHQVYVALKSLNLQRIISFIPRSKVPQITYRTRRISTEEIYLSPAVYEERLEQYKERIQQVISYATNDQICRSRQLLRYFGEERSTDCRQCDVCITHSSDYLSEEKLAPYKQKILGLLADKKRHHITELKQIEGYNDLLDTALEYLIHEEIIYIDGSYIFTT